MDEYEDSRRSMFLMGQVDRLEKRVSELEAVFINRGAAIDRLMKENQAQREQLKTLNYWKQAASELETINRVLAEKIEKLESQTQPEEDK